MLVAGTAGGSLPAPGWSARSADRTTSAPGTRFSQRPDASLCRWHRRFRSVRCRRRFRSSCCCSFRCCSCLRRRCCCCFFSCLRRRSPRSPPRHFMHQPPIFLTTLHTNSSTTAPTCATTLASLGSAFFHRVLPLPLPRVVAEEYLPRRYSPFPDFVRKRSCCFRAKRWWLWVSWSSPHTRPSANLKPHGPWTRGADAVRMWFVT